MFKNFIYIYYLLELWKDGKGYLGNSGTTVSCAVLQGNRLFTASIEDNCQTRQAY